MSHGEDDSIEFEHSTNALSASASASGKRLLVLNITGNPGLIGYYRTFLALIYKGLRAKYDDDCAVRVCGVSLAGFELLSAQSNARDVMGTRGPYDLEQQIQYIDRVLDRYCRREEGEAAASAVQEPLRVILLGHSVGSYILLEVLRRRKLRARQAGTGDYGGPKIIAGICLFPTVTHIAKSQSGKRFSVRRCCPSLSLTPPVPCTLPVFRSAKLTLNIRRSPSLPFRTSQSLPAFLCMSSSPGYRLVFCRNL